MTPEEQFDQLWNDYLEGELPPEGILELNQFFKDHPDLVTEAADLLQTHRLLGYLHQAERDSFVQATLAAIPQGEDVFVEGVLAHSEGPGARRPRIARGPLVLATVLSALATLLLSLIFLQPSGQEAIVELTGINGPLQFTGEGGRVRDTLEVGTVLGGGTLETIASESWVELTFLDGTRTTLSGPAMMTISDFGQKEVHLRHGAFTADVMPQPKGKPLRIITPSAEAEVLGTQLNIVADDFATRLTVNEGLVRVKRLADGEVEEVPSDYVVVAALEKVADFKAVPRKEHVNTWQDSLPEGVTYGKWSPPGVEHSVGRLRATPMLWREPDKPDEPMLLFVSALKLSVDNQAPTLVHEGAKLRVRGRLNSNHVVVFGFTAVHAKGGFAGKYQTYREVEASDAFEVIIPLAEFKRKREQFPENSVGLEVYDFWMLTVQEDVALAIEEAELSR